MYGFQARELTPGVHRGLPSSSLTMVFSLDRPLRTAPTWQKWTSGVLDSQWTVLGGLHTRSALIEQPGHWRGVQLALHPLASRRLFGVPASALPVDAWDARDLFGAPLDRTRERLAAAQSWEGVYHAILDFLLARLDQVQRPPVRAEVVETWRVLHRSRGRVRVGELSDHAGYSRRRLTEVFSAELGLTPKMAARIIRFDGARQDLGTRAGEAGCSRSGLDLAGLAAEHGYYDHAHLVRDFTDFSGLSPTGWLDKEFPNIQANTLPDRR